MATMVWAYEPIEELGNSTGMVACEEDLAKRLLREGKVQDLRVGARHLKELTSVSPSTGYMTKVYAAKKKKRKAAPKKDD